MITCGFTLWNWEVCINFGVGRNQNVKTLFFIGSLFSISRFSKPLHNTSGSTCVRFFPFSSEKWQRKSKKTPTPVEMIWPTRHIRYQHPCVYLRDTHSSLDANNNKKYWLTSSSFSSSSPMSLSLPSNSSLLNILWSSWLLKVSPKLPSSRSTWWADDESFSVFPRWCCTCLLWPLGPRRRLRATAFSVRRSADCLLERLPPAFFTW